MKSILFVFTLLLATNLYAGLKSDFNEYKEMITKDPTKVETKNLVNKKGEVLKKFYKEGDSRKWQKASEYVFKECYGGRTDKISGGKIGWDLFNKRTKHNPKGEGKEKNEKLYKLYRRNYAEFEDFCDTFQEVYKKVALHKGGKDLGTQKDPLPAEFPFKIEEASLD